MLDVFTYSDTSEHALTEAEEAEAIAAAQAGDEAATERLLMAYGPALRAAVSNFATGVKAGRNPWGGEAGIGTSSFEVADVQGAALVGFLETIREHDPAVSPRLAGTIRRRIAREIADLYASTMPFAVPERTLSRFYGILREAEGDDALAEALAPERGMDPATFRAVFAAVRGTSSLDRLQAEADETGASLAPTAIFAPSPIVDVEDRVLVDLAFRAVEDDEERICRLAYGFTEYDPQPDAEIAHRMGLTRPTVQRKRGKALDKMRKAIGATPA